METCIDDYGRTRLLQYSIRLLKCFGKLSFLFFNYLIYIKALRHFSYFPTGTPTSKATFVLEMHNVQGFITLLPKEN